MVFWEKRVKPIRGEPEAWEELFPGSVSVLFNNIYVPGIAVQFVFPQIISSLSQTSCGEIGKWNNTARDVTRRSQRPVD